MWYTFAICHVMFGWQGLDMDTTWTLVITDSHSPSEITVDMDHTISPSHSPIPTSQPFDLGNPNEFSKYSSMRLWAALATLPPSDNGLLRQKFLDGLDWELVSPPETYNIKYFPYQIAVADIICPLYLGHSEATCGYTRNRYPRYSSCQNAAVPSEGRCFGWIVQASLPNWGGLADCRSNPDAGWLVESLGLCNIPRTHSMFLPICYLRSSSSPCQSITCIVKGSRGWSRDWRPTVN